MSINNADRRFQKDINLKSEIKLNSEVGIIRYLSSGLIKGIGPSLAKRIVDHFGIDTLRIMEEEPNELSKISGIGDSKIKAITESWHKNKNFQEIVNLLGQHNISIHFATKIWEKYGNNSINIINSDPYQFAKDIKGIGFLSADRIAIKAGMPLDSPQRVAAAIDHILNECADNGSSCMPAELIGIKTEKDLNIPSTIVHTTLINAVNAGNLIAVDSHNGNRVHSFNQYEHHNIDDKHESKLLIFLPIYFYIERGLAKKFTEISSQKSNIFQNHKLEDLFNWLKTAQNITLSEGQIEAIEAIYKNKCVIVTGGPGTGKTTLISSILKLLLQFGHPHGLKVKLVAPTGRAAKRLSQSTKSYAMTIHRLLEFDQVQKNFRYHDGNKLNCDFLVIDETSMIDLKLMHTLLRALPARCHLLIVGDVDQLPSIGAGQVLKDLIASQVLPVVILRHIFRQVANSEIIKAAHMINVCKVPKLVQDRSLTIKTNNGEYIKKNDCLFIDIAPNVSISETLTKILCYELKGIAEGIVKKKERPFDLLKDVQVLSPMQKGECGVKNLNTLLQKQLNKSITSNLFLENYGSRYYLDDKVMQITNNYNKNVFNGDIGFIQSIYKESGELEVLFDDATVRYKINELNQLVHSYAITIHKSQGSEYPVVLLVISTQHFIMLHKNLIYTALTRAKELAILVGQKSALCIAAKKTNATERSSMLKKWLEKTN